MLTRIIVAVIGIALLLSVLWLLPLWVFGIFIAAISAIAAHEFLRCTSRERGSLIVTIPVIASSAIIPILSLVEGKTVLIVITVFILQIFLFARLVFSFRSVGTKTGLTELLAAFFAGAIFPIMFASLLRLGQGSFGPAHILLPFVIAFSCDSGAYFCGVFLGKHKLAPLVSPNKTIEGSIGGFVFGVLFSLAYGLLLKSLGFETNIPLLLAYGLLGSLACEFGDLTFSAIKRVYGIKDYGRLLPGHGGALDRFDGLLFVAPLTALLLLFFPAIS